MDELVEFPLRDGTFVRFEAEAAPAGRPVTRGGGRAPATLATAAQTFEESLSGVAPACVAVIDQLRAAGEGIRRVEIELGLKVSADTGIVIARAGGEASLRVVVSWERS